MGKYFINEDNSSSDNVWRAAIANELAEANRLKRIELKLTHAWSKQVKKAVEDQA